MLCVCFIHRLREFAFAEIHLGVLLHEPETEQRHDKK